MKNAILEDRKVEIVVLVGWSHEATQTRTKKSYKQATQNLLTVGDWLATWICQFKDMGYYTHGIGHSLGAHLLGRAGRMSGNRLDRISGLDPAGPRFETKFNEHALKASDAAFVDVIHSDGYAKRLIKKIFYPDPVKYLGTLLPVGDVDFYPNDGACRHFLSYEFYTWSVSNPGAFKTNFQLCYTPAIRTPVKDYDDISSFAEMGFYADAPNRVHSGLFYLKTNKAPPYALPGSSVEDVRGIRATEKTNQKNKNFKSAAKKKIKRLTGRRRSNNGGRSSASQTS